MKTKNILSLILIFSLVFCLGSINSFAAEMATATSEVVLVSSEADIKYEHYTKEEIANRFPEVVQEPIQNQIIDASTRVILVYEMVKDIVSGVPRTADLGMSKYIIIGFLAFIILAILSIKNRKRQIAFLLAISLIFGTNFINLTYASNRLLASYDFKFKSTVGNSFAPYTDIEDYKYIGYIKEKIEEANTVKATNEIKHSSGASFSSGSSSVVEPNTTEPTTSTTVETTTNTNETQGQTTIDNTSNNDNVATKSEELPKDVVEIRTVEKELILSYKDLDTVYVNDESLEKGKTLKEEGKNGKLIITYEVVFINGKEISYMEVTRQKIAPVATTVYVGIKETDTKVTEETSTEETREATTEATTEETKETTTEATTEETKETTTEATTEETKETTTEATTEETTTKNRIRKERRTENVEIPFETKEINDDTIEEGQKVVEEGEVGISEVVYEDTYEDEELITSEIITSTIVRAPKNKIIKIGTKKKVNEKPIVEIVSITKDSGAKKILVDYKLTDKDSAYVSAIAKVYKKSDLSTPVKEVEITNLSTEDKDDKFEISGLELNTEYVLKTYLTYNDGENNQSGIEESTADFELDFKKIELKYINSIKLYDAGTQITILDTIPENLDSYYVVISSDNMKDIVLPVKSIAEEVVNGKTVYKVGVHTSELTHDNLNIYADDYYFNIEKQAEAVSGAYTSFNELIAAMKQNPSGTFVLGSNISATAYELEEGATSYISEEFSGTLVGENNGEKFAIHGLKAPLFNTTRNATIRNIDFKDVDINTTDMEVGTIAKLAYASTFEDVAVQGDIVARKDVAGLVYRLDSGSRVNNALFKGSITATERAKGANESVELRNLVGGIAGFMANRSTISKAKVLADINVVADSPYHKIGGILGRGTGTTKVEEVYAKGTLTNTGTNNVGSVQIGGIIGSTWQGGLANNLLSEMKVINGSLTYGDRNYSYANVTNNFAVENEASGAKDTLNNRVTTLSREEADAKLESFAITANLEDSEFDDNKGVTDYSGVDAYDESKKSIYANIEKIIPFYDKPLIVSYGNKVAADSNFATKEIMSTILMIDKKPAYDLAHNKEAANELLVIYSDSSSEILPVSYKGTFKDTEIEEYDIAGTELIYTPELFVRDYDALVSSLVEEMKAMNYMDVVRSIYPDYTYSWSVSTAKMLAMGVDNMGDNTARENGIAELKANNVDPYYLKESFDEVKENIKDYIIAFIEKDTTLDKTGNISPKQVLDRLAANKEKILLGLAYVNRWYDVKVGDANLLDFTLYHQDMFGNKIDSLDNIIKVATAGDNNIKAEHSAKLYTSVFGATNGKSDLAKYLEAYKDIFDPEHSMNEWFKNSTKALIYEAKTTMPELADVSTEIWYNLNRSSVPVAKSIILPLLTMEHEGLGIVSGTSTVHFSTFSKYYTLGEGETFDGNEAAKEAVLSHMKFTAEQMTRYFEFWYRMSQGEFKNKVFNNGNMPMLTWDGHRYNESWNWRLPFTKEETEITRTSLGYTDTATREVFAPIGKWMRPNGAGAYANGEEITFIYNKALDKTGNSVMTHESTHNLDGSLYFEGNGRREGMGAEDFAKGLLQSIDDVTGDMSRGINLDTDYNTYDNGSKLATRLHNATPERFKTRQDLEEYFARSYEFAYLTAYAEAEAMLELKPIDRYYMLTKVEKVPDGDHYKDRYSAFYIPGSAEAWNEVASMTSINDFIDHNIVMGRRNRAGEPREIGRNTYTADNMFLANYGTYTTDHGAPGSNTFKQTAFEMLAVGGYDAFINYVSNKLRASAIAENQAFGDAYIVKKTFEGKGDYLTFNDMRKAMYAKVYAKKDRLKPFVVNGVTYNSYEDLKNLMREAVKKDADLASKEKGLKLYFNSDNVLALKVEMYRYYINSTDDFRTSIFSE